MADARQAIIFDDGMGELGPMTDLRPAPLVRTGALTTLERLVAQFSAAGITSPVALRVPGVLEELTRERIELPVNAPIEENDVLLVNGRCVHLPEGAAELDLGSALVDESNALLAARLTGKEAMAYLEDGGMPSAISSRQDCDAPVLDRPWDVIRHRDEALAFDLAVLGSGMGGHVPAGVTVINADGVRLGSGATVAPSAVLDAESGPIVIDEGATVRPGAVIVGPAYVGRGSTVLEQTLVKANTSIGPVCKIAGEVGGTIFQGFANKAHDGHLGDSWVGEWANLGAGTTNSNLLNTYGEIVACLEPGGQRERTGLMYFGAIIGDHVKTAIMTRIMTGSVFATGAMIAQVSPPTTVGRFEWLTDERRQPYRLKKFLDVARTVMARRGVEFSEAQRARLEALHARAAGGDDC